MKMRKMKKLWSMLLALLCVAALTACGGKDSDVSSGDDSANGGKDAAGVKVIDIDLTEEQYAFGVDKTQPELLEQVNAFVREIKENGTLESICEKYFGEGDPEAVTSAELDSSKDQLVVATNASFEPFEYMQGDKYLGIDMEIAKLLADKLGKELVIQNMEFNAVCLSVGQQKCDIAMAGLTVSPDREEYVTFSESYYEASQKLVVPENDTTFDGCKTAEDVEKILKGMSASDKIGAQSGTTGQFYIEGSDDLEFEKLPATCVPFSNGSLAVQDMLNGNIKYVIIDAAPAAAIAKAINEMQ